MLPVIGSRDGDKQIRYPRLLKASDTGSMGYTTTASTTYSLLKYSRSYPTVNAASAEWQHFTNPVLRLVLDVTKTEKSELRNVRLKVIWTIQTGGVVTVNDNSEIVLASFQNQNNLSFPGFSLKLRLLGLLANRKTWTCSRFHRCNQDMVVAL
jgi:hypothetical protein